MRKAAHTGGLGCAEGGVQASGVTLTSVVMTAAIIVSFCC
ncbi:MAG: hypothetical protein RLZZ387_3133 [Chloroflexota bacterium]|jgi:hypothetical protein